MSIPGASGLPRLAPVAPGERVELLDIFRGVALLGVLIANMRGFSGPFAAYFDHTLMWQDPLSRATQFMVDTFVSGKFITIFSFLFGIGFAIQIDRAATRPHGFLARRFGFLLALGLAHIYLLWWGDILLTYSVFGFALLLFRNRQPATLLYWAAGLYLWPLILFAGAALASAFAGNAHAQPPPDPAGLANLIQTYATGSYLEILPARIKEANRGLGFVPFFGPRLLGIFLFGLWVWRRGILQNLGSHRDLLRRCQRWGLPVGLSLAITSESLMLVLAPNLSKPSPAGFIYLLLASVSVPVLSLCYLVAIARLAPHPAWRARFQLFAPVGRTALTNYLLQTIICTLIFYGYGFGLFGRVGPLPGLALSLAIFGAQVIASRHWLRRYSQGPGEALWRWVTYARWRNV